MKWVNPKTCRSIWTWIFCSWDFASGWSGPYVKIYTCGFRVFGLEFEWTRRFSYDG
jgi:hypothetical protein